MQILKGRRFRVGELAFSHCGRWLAAGGRGGVHVWDTANPSAKPLTPAWAGRSTALAFRADGRLFFDIRTGNWFLFDPAANELTTLPDEPAAASIVASPDGRHVARLYSGSIWTWTVPDDGVPVRQPIVQLSRAYVRCAAFTPDGSQFVTGDWKVRAGSPGRSPELTVRDTSSRRILGHFTGAAGTTAHVAFAGGGGYVLANWGATLACWVRAEPDEPPRKVVNPSRRHFVSMAAHPAGPLLTTDNDRLVQVWDVPALTTDRTIEWNIGRLDAVAVSPDGTRVAVGGSGGTVLVWDWD